VKIRVCPCGNRLKTNQEFYCSCRCKGKYHKAEPVKRGFEIEVPKNKTQRRVGKGFYDYLHSRTEW